MNNFLEKAFLRWEFVDFKDATISIATHWLHYGTWAFWGMRWKVGESWATLFRIDDHVKRLSNSAKFLWYNIDTWYIKDKIIDFVRINSPSSDFYIRPLVYTSDLGISPRLHNIDYDFLIYGIELWNYLDPSGISCSISSYMRQSDISFPLRWKITGAYITSSLAKSEAINRWFDEAILMNSKQKVSEWSGMNIFIVRNGIAYTPWLSEDILEWITRDSIIKLSKYLNLEVIEREIDKSELFIRDEVFLTWTAAKITPVNQIEQYHLPDNKPIFKLLRDNLEKMQNWDLGWFENYITKIEY